MDTPQKRPSPRRPNKAVADWTKEEAVSFIRQKTRDEGLGWVVFVNHAYQRMDERDYDMEEIYDTIVKGKAVHWEPGNFRFGDWRLTMEYATRTTRSSTVVSVADDREHGMIITVLPKKTEYRSRS